ncbi:flagellar basal body protein FliL [Primorskyibacter flagellatus]|uniref:Flagellar protein FliL n=1 Tax=Primorskyibacter flagellatus TaxID=1387277 RepID=A0A917AEQ3_9RHOB|nr:flagellar basal body-associated FliL family protein [Primorskyibacter flagellatus]GGE47285.1 flagellar basal body protein FliL [Primorskyibacter flagellatus]
MSEPETEDESPPKKASRLPLVIGLVVALVGGGGSFFAIYSGLLFGSPASEDMAEAEPEETDMPDVSYVPIEPMTISLGRSSDARHLRFRAQLEVPKSRQGAVETVQPRVVDVLNSYLRAVEIADLEDPSALVRLRSQMLRRVQVVAGPGNVNDLLVMEFVMN